MAIITLDKPTREQLEGYRFKSFENAYKCVEEVFDKFPEDGQIPDIAYAAANYIVECGARVNWEGLNDFQNALVFAIYSANKTAIDALHGAFAILKNNEEMQAAFAAIKTFDEAYWELMTFGYTNSPLKGENKAEFKKTTIETLEENPSSFYSYELTAFAAAIRYLIRQLIFPATKHVQYTNTDSIFEFAAAILSFDSHAIADFLVDINWTPVIERLSFDEDDTIVEVLKAAMNYDKAEFYRYQVRAAADWLLNKCSKHNIMGDVLKKACEIVLSGDADAVQSFREDIYQYAMGSPSTFLAVARVLQICTVMSVSCSTMPRYRKAAKYVVENAESLQYCEGITPFYNRLIQAARMIAGIKDPMHLDTYETLIPIKFWEHKAMYDLIKSAEVFSKYIQFGTMDMDYIRDYYLPPIVAANIPNPEPNGKTEREEDEEDKASDEEEDNDRPPRRIRFQFPPNSGEEWMDDDDVPGLLSIAESVAHNIRDHAQIVMNLAIGTVAYTAIAGATIAGVTGGIKIYKKGSIKYKTLGALAASGSAITGALIAQYHHRSVYDQFEADRETACYARCDLGATIDLYKRMKRRNQKKKGKKESNKQKSG